MARGKRAKGAQAGPKKLPPPVVPPNRGRIQVQGIDMSPERSYSWAQDQPPSAAASVAQLDALRDQCTPTQLQRRTEAFPKARRYISGRAGTGVDAPLTRTFQDRDLPKVAEDARVDIDVFYGRAFV